MRSQFRRSQLSWLKYRVCNAITRRVGKYQGALDYLRFLGFTPKESDAKSLAMVNENDTKTSVTASSALASPLNPYRVVQRALSVLKSLLKEKAPTSEEVFASQIGPVDRQLAVYDVEPTQLTTLNGATSFLVP